MSVLRREDASLAYRERGVGTPVVLLHGFSQRGDTWTELIGFLADQHRWITIDIRGHGVTTTRAGASHAMEACANDVIALLDELGIARCHLAGYSMGGRLALFMATRHPERLQSLTVISGHAGLGGDERGSRMRRDAELADRIETEGIEWFAEYWEQLPIFSTLRERRPDLAETLQRRRRDNDPRGLASSLRDMGAAAMPPLWDSLEGIRCPVLLIAGADDERYVEYAQRLGTALKHARVEIVAGAGHSVHLEEPAGVAKIISRFLRQVDGDI